MQKETALSLLKRQLDGDEQGSTIVELMHAISHANRTARVVYRDNDIVIEKATYNCGSKKVLVERDNDDLAVRAIKDTSRVISELSGVTGMSVIKHSNFSSLLTQNALVVLLATIDLVRKETLSAYIGEPQNNQISVDTIRLELLTLKEKTLVHMIVTDYGLQTPEDDQIQEGLEELKSLNIIDEHDKRYTLREDYHRFAQFFLIPDTIMLLESFELEGKRQRTRTDLAIIAGGKDILHLSMVENKFLVKTLSSMQLLNLAEQYLNCTITPSTENK